MQRLARAHHIVPPTVILGIVSSNARHMMRGIEGMTYSRGIAGIEVELAIVLYCQLILRQYLLTTQMQWLIKGDDLGLNNADGTLGDRNKRTARTGSRRGCARR